MNKSSLKRFRNFTILMILLIIINSLYAESNNRFNWALWKGPFQTGVSPETDFNPEALNSPLKINWKKNVGVGYSNVAISGDYLYTLGYDKSAKVNVLYCLNVKSGDEVWRQSYPATKGGYEGPKTSPVIDNGKVYTLSQDGDFFCNDALTGKQIWKKNVIEKFNAKNLKWFFSSSVCIYKNAAIVNACRYGIALNKNTGETIWSSPSDKGNYASPVTYEFKGETLAAIYGYNNLYAVNVKDGKLKWSYPWKTKYDIIAADPVYYDNKIFISSGYGNGCALIDISKGKPVTLWENKDLCNHFSTSIILDGFIYGINGNAGRGELKCLDIKTGQVKWSQDNGFGSIIAANGYFIMLNEKGSLFIIKIDPSGYQEVSRHENILKKLCWTAPVLCRSTLYLRNNKGDIVSIDISR